MTEVSVLVTGGAGYVGAHVCKALAESGYRPVAYDNLSTGHRTFVRFGEFVEGDIRDTVKLRDAIRTHRAQAIMHLAAHANVAESVADPEKYHDNNVEGSRSVLRAMRESSCTRIVFSSSCAVYGEPTQIPISEGAPINPISPYGTTKATVERMLADHRASHRLDFIALRYFNACGADDSGAIGELRDVETHLIPRALMHILGHCQDFRILGADFDTPDGTPIRDFVHVSDIAEAHVIALEAMLSQKMCGAFNLGTGRGHSVKEVLDAISRETGVRLVVREGRRRPGDPAALVADAGRATQQLGWSSRHSDLGEIIRSSWRWHQKVHPRRAAAP